MPLCADGMRTEPPPSLPRAIGHIPAAIAAPDPALEPPGVRSGFQGLRVVSNTGLWPTPQGEWDRLLEQLAARATGALTEVERQRWQALSDAAVALGPDDGALLMSALIGGYVPRAR